MPDPLNIAVLTISLTVFVLSSMWVGIAQSGAIWNAGITGESRGYRG